MLTRGAAVAVCLVLSGCISAPPPAPVTPTQPAVDTPTSGDVLPCDDFVAARSTAPKGRRVVLGVVALPTGPSSPALQLYPSGLPDHARRLFAKDGLVVRAGAALEIVVPSRMTGRVGIGWTDATPRTRVVVPGCAPASGTGWLVYVGGYWVDRPSCVPLVVRSGGRRERVRIGLGVPCRGRASVAG